MSDIREKSCWIVGEGLVGLQNQLIGLAEALGLTFEVKTATKPDSFWRFLPSPFWPNPLSLTTDKKPLSAPWPDILISAGRCGVAVSQAMRRASGGKTFTIHIQDPLTDPQKFDVVIVPEHDRIRGDNVMTTYGATHRITTEKLAEAADHFRPLLASLPRPLIAVLVGGASKHQDFPPAIMRDLAQKLAAAAQSSGGSLAVTPSRRTGAENEAVLKEVLQNTPALIWDGQGENPYFGLLALADAIVVTSDSVSMISEACFTGKPVYVYDLPGGSKRILQFEDGLRRRGMTRGFMGEIASWHYPPLDETRKAADFVRQRWTKKFGTPEQIKQGT
jgi:hypothetical protein